MGWFLASRETPLPRAKKRGASQLDLARDTHHPALRDSDKGSPTSPRFLTSGQQRIGESANPSVITRLFEANIYAKFDASAPADFSLSLPDEPG
jgi:hypothetical protein